LTILEIHTRLGSRLCLSSLLFVVLCQTLLSYASCLCVFLFVIAAKEINVIIILLGSSCGLGWVDCESCGFWAIGGVCFAWVSWKRRELGFEGGCFT
jgi:hypothetical protein